jgi:hypothetical protein
MTDNLKPTHIAYGKKYLTKKIFTWLEIGKGRWDPNTGEFHGMPDRGILGASITYIRFMPIGKGPPPEEPERPGDEQGDDELL